MQSNLAARAGRWSASHRKAAIGGWIAFVVAALLLGMAVGGTNAPDDAQLGTGDSGRAERVLAGAFPETTGEQILLQSSDDAARDAAAADATAALKASDAVTSVDAAVDSRDGKSTLVAFELAGSEDDAEEALEATQAITASVGASNPGVEVGQVGGASIAEAYSQANEDDFKKAETMSLPITLIILVVAFGSLVAAGIPLLLALSAVMATLGVIAGVSQVWPMEETVNSVVLLVGLAVGVDYSLFYLRREREERAAGRSAEAALQAAAATSGRAVLISGLTVIVAMAGMYLAGAATFTAIATGTIIVVAIALIASVTVLPAVLSKLGDRVEKGRIPVLGRRRRGGGDSRAWGFVLDRVLRRPKIAAAVAGGFLVALTIPAFGLQMALPGMDSLPRDIPAIQTFDRVEAAFPGREVAATAVVQAGDVRGGEVAAGIERLADAARSTDGLYAVDGMDVSADGTVAAVSIPVAGDGTDEASVAALETLRTQVIPEAFRGVDGVEVNVSGITAGTEDFNSLMQSRAPIVFAFVLALAFLLLLVTFRSVVVPIKAIVLNLLSVGAAYGVLVLVFQHGWGESLLGFESTGAITSWLPMFLFVILFGLSMDYHVFILSRVRELVDRGARTEDAVASAIKSTAGTVTSAAMIMVAVFAVFGSLGQIEFKQMGVGLAVAILLDATIVRAVLLPATMKLLGERNWWLPKRLGWLPEFSHEGAVEPARA